MNWLKKLLTKRAMAPVLRELDRAIEKLKNGKTALEVLPSLQSSLERALRGFLPPVMGEILPSLVLSQFDWVGVYNLHKDEIITRLVVLRQRVEGARL